MNVGATFGELDGVTQLHANAVTNCDRIDFWPAQYPVRLKCQFGISSSPDEPYVEGL